MQRKSKSLLTTRWDTAQVRPGTFRATAHAWTGADLAPQDVRWVVGARPVGCDALDGHAAVLTRAHVLVKADAAGLAPEARATASDPRVGGEGQEEGCDEVEGFHAEDWEYC